MVLLWLFLSQTSPSTFPNRPYFSLICRKRQVCAVREGLSGTVCSLCAQLGRQEDVACTYCILQIFVILGFPTRVRVKRPFFQIWLDKGRRYERRASIVLTLVCWGISVLKGQSRGGETACKGFQFLNQNSNVSVFIFLPFIH